MGLKKVIKIKEIFNSISGEVSLFSQGRLTTFLRLAECPVNCEYCDTDHSGGVEMSWMKLISEISDKYQFTNHLCITGGEPALYENIEMLAILYNNVWMETSGCVPFTHLIGKMNLVVDYKLSGTKLKPLDLENYYLLKSTDFVKFIIRGEEDMEKAEIAYNLIKKESDVQIAFAPIYTKVSASTLMAWLPNYNITNAILNVQLHKMIGLQ